MKYADKVGDIIDAACTKEQDQCSRAQKNSSEYMEALGISEDKLDILFRSSILNQDGEMGFFFSIEFDDLEFSFAVIEFIEPGRVKDGPRRYVFCACPTPNIDEKINEVLYSDENTFIFILSEKRHAEVIKHLKETELSEESNVVALDSKSVGSLHLVPPTEESDSESGTVETKELPP